MEQFSLFTKLPGTFSYVESNIIISGLFTLGDDK